MKLTPREQEIAALLIRGEKREAIASALGIHVRTVDFHLQNIRQRCGAVCLVTLAVRVTRLRLAG